MIVESYDCLASRTIRVRTERQSMLGFACYPPPLFPEPLAGDIYLSREADWTGVNRELLLPVLSHEMGHAIGMGELWWVEDSMMNPAVAPHRFEPRPLDARIISCLYQGTCR